MGLTEALGHSMTRVADWKPEVDRDSHWWRATGDGGERRLKAVRAREAQDAWRELIDAGKPEGS